LEGWSIGERNYFFHCSSTPLLYIVGHEIRTIQVRGLRPNWNVGILEYWNNGFWDNGMVGLENLNEYNFIGFLAIVTYFLERKQKMDVLRASS
jgi:hypothetical protein